MKKESRIRIGCIIFLTLSLLITGVHPARVFQETILIVDNEGDGDYTTIQEAINNAESGDVIQIYSGLYNETLVIETDSIVIQGIDHELATGIDTEYPIINGNEQGNVVEFYGQYCTLTNCIITNSGHGIVDAGIRLYASNTVIDANGLYGNHYGIFINNCSHNQIKNNYIVSNTMDGIYLLYTEHNIIASNTIKENGFQGLFLWETQQNTIIDNTISLNEKDGIHLRDLCIDNMITDNSIHSNGIDGIKCKQSTIYDNTISNNEIYSNAYNGIHIMDGYSNTISDNTIYLNLLNGIHIGNADNNRIIRNTIYDNKEEGIVLLFSEANNNQLYYNNIINDNAYDGGTNFWDDGRETGGNYWSYYSGIDENGDGIGETPYIIQGNQNQDNAPFINQLSPPQKPIKPAGPTLGVLETIYIYTTSSLDHDYNQIQYGWDWDGDNNVDEWTDFYPQDQICETPHSWYANGTYHIKVKSMDNQGFQSDWSDPLPVSMPKNPMLQRFSLGEIINFLLQHLQERFQRFFYIL